MASKIENEKKLQLKLHERQIVAQEKLAHTSEEINQRMETAMCQGSRPWNWRKSRPTDCGGESRTKQSFKDDCDVNLIVKRHASTGAFSHLNPRMPAYGDFSGATELNTAMDLCSQALADFNDLPAAVRQACNNDPVVFLQEVNDPDGVLALAAAGLPMADGWEPPTVEEVAGTGGEKATPPADAEGVT